MESPRGELKAIEHGLIDIIQQYTTKHIVFKPCTNWSIQNKDTTTNPFDTIRIISDSQTSLNWIAGSYRIKEKRIFDILRRIRDTMCYINQHMNVKIRIQWTKSHVQTIGNELADELAKEAVEVIKEQWIPYNTFNWTDKNCGDISTAFDGAINKKKRMDFMTKYPTFNDQPWDMISKKATRNEIIKANEQLWIKIYTQTCQKHSDANQWCKQYEILEWDKQWRNDASYMNRIQYKWLNDLRID
eukprot:753240_1